MKQKRTLAENLALVKAKTTAWQNEIHPRSSGYRKLSAHWQPVLTAVFEGTIQVAAQGTPTPPDDGGR